MKLMIDPDTIKSTRENRYGWTQEQLAEYLGLDRSNVSRMENGQSKPGGPAMKLLRHWIADAPNAPFRLHESPNCAQSPGEGSTATVTGDAA
jgi:DNA-binding transcriptional regulator YiaG